MGEGKTECPICGIDVPHSHTEKTLVMYRKAQAFDALVSQIPCGFTIRGYGVGEWHVCRRKPHTFGACQEEEWEYTTPHEYVLPTWVPQELRDLMQIIAAESARGEKPR